MRERGVERAVLPQDLLEADGTDERRQNHGNQQQREQGALGGEVKAVREPGERNREQTGEKGARDRKQEGVLKPFEIDAVAPDFQKVVEGPMPVGVKERAPERLDDGPEKEAAEEKGCDPPDRNGKSA